MLGGSASGGTISPARDDDNRRQSLLQRRLTDEAGDNFERSTFNSQLSTLNSQHSERSVRLQASRASSASPTVRTPISSHSPSSDPPPIACESGGLGRGSPARPWRENARR